MCRFSEILRSELRRHCHQQCSLFCNRCLCGKKNTTQHIICLIVVFVWIAIGGPFAFAARFFPGIFIVYGRPFVIAIDTFSGTNQNETRTHLVLYVGRCTLPGMWYAFTGFRLNSIANTIRRVADTFCKFVNSGIKGGFFLKQSSKTVDVGRTGGNWIAFNERATQRPFMRTRSMAPDLNSKDVGPKSRNSAQSSRCVFPWMTSDAQTGRRHRGNERFYSFRN